MEYLKRFLQFSRSAMLLLGGLLFALFWVILQPGLFMLLALLRQSPPQAPFVAAFLFYAVPFVANYLLGRVICRCRVGCRGYRAGVFFVRGMALGVLLFFYFNWDAVLRVNMGGGCGTCAQSWAQSAILLPSLLGLGLTLRHHSSTRSASSEGTAQFCRQSYDEDHANPAYHQS